MKHQEPFITDGHVVRVLSVDDGSGIVQGVTPYAKSSSFQILSGPLPAIGELVMVGTSGWTWASEALWRPTNSIGVVRRLLSDTEVLIEDGYTFSICPIGSAKAPTAGTTVEFNSFDGVVRVLADEPIRIRDAWTREDEDAETYRIEPSSKPLSFDDFGGYPEVIARARELIETQFETRALLEKIGAQPVKGILFTGPPGTGKTYLAKIIAHVSKADFFLVSGPSIISKWLGDTEGTLRRIFEAAAQSGRDRTIIFFDEIDSIAERRSGDSHEASRRLVAQLLTLMDGFSHPDKSIVVIAATNRAESLDPALLRPGRFDWEIEFGPPNLEDRLQILQVGARTVKTEQDLPLEDLAVRTEGWSAADLKLLWTEAALVAAGDRRAQIADEDLVQAYERVIGRSRRALQPHRQREDVEP